MRREPGDLTEARHPCPQCFKNLVPDRPPALLCVECWKKKFGWSIWCCHRCGRVRVPRALELCANCWEAEWTNVETLAKEHRRDVELVAGLMRLEFAGRDEDYQARLARPEFQECLSKYLERSHESSA